MNRVSAQFAIVIFAGVAGCSAECIAIEQAQKKVGQLACVKAKVVRVNESQSGNTYLDFCENYRQCPFSVVVFHRDAKHLGDLKALAGKDVEIFGPVQEYAGRAEIVLRDKRQFDGEKSKYIPPQPQRHDMPSAAQHGPPRHRMGSIHQFRHHATRPRRTN